MSLLSRIAVEAARAYGMFAKKGGISASYLVVAGGGAGGNAQNSTQTSGSNSVLSGTGISTVTSIGGGFGNSNGTVGNGGSGGGANYGSTYGTGTAGQGNNGGIGLVVGSGQTRGAGGGGASAVGGNASSGAAGNGGNGTASSISGSSVTYAGGGGGGVEGTATAGSGGSGGGGAGSTTNTATAGTANTGGGGGGGGGTGYTYGGSGGGGAGGLLTGTVSLSALNTYSVAVGAGGAQGAGGGAGGSGIVIISYASSTPLFVGGTLTTSGGNQIHTFTSSGTLSPITPITASYLVVAGGGGGGAGYASTGGAGGGAGGLLSGSTTLYSGASYVVTVGAGGSGSSAYPNSAVSGGNSSLVGTGLTTITSTGGGFGATYTVASNAGGNGGSGGGSEYGGTAGTGISGQGYAGGGSTSGATYGCGGGGGSGGIGQTGTTTASGNGGIATANSITGTSIYYAGGGGGGFYSTVSGNGLGGGTSTVANKGGGGNGGLTTTGGASLGVSGTPNLGGGGGGGGGNGNAGGSGGSGVVIISYAGSQVFNGGLVTSSGGNTIHTFTSTGALTPLTNNLNNSLRFRSSASANLTKTLSTPTNNKIFTWSAWVKIGAIPSAREGLFVACNSGATSYFALEFNASAGLTIEDSNSAGTSNALVTTQVFRDPSAWYHIVMAIDTTQATAANRYKLYVNGNQITSFSSATYPSQNSSPYMNSAVAHSIGSWQPNYGLYFDGYMTDINFIDGQALEPYYFGNNDANQVWKPIQYKGTYGINGFYLTFGNTTSTTTLGYDSSPNGNNWTCNNISLTAGTTYDAMLDVPTNTSATVANYPTLNPLTNGGGTYSNGNLQFVGPTAWVNSLSTMEIPSTGKFYAEATLTGTAITNNQGDAYAYFGVRPTTASATTAAGTDGNALFVVDTGWYYNFVAYPSGTNIGSKFSAGDVIGLAIDRTANTYTFYKNNTSFSSGTINYTSGNPLSFVYGSYQNLYGQMAVNFGQRPFTYTPPTGYVALNTYNLPTPTILQGNKYMDATLWTGNGAPTNVIVNQAQFKPDFVWIKPRTSTSWHNIYDSIRGVGKELNSNYAGAEITNNANGYLNSFDSNGFTVVKGSTGTDNVNANSITFVGWNWQAGQGSTSSNTSGSLTSTVSVNTTAGFSIVTYTGTGVAATVGHGLGVAPKFIVVKNRNAAESWRVYHTVPGATKYLNLNTTEPAVTASSVWNNTAPTSTVFSIANDAGVSGNGNGLVAYCWAEITGYSKFGSYVGNANADGPFVYCGFRPKFLLIKDSTTTGYNWYLFDSSRNTYNVMGEELEPNLGDAAITQTDLDFTSNGFKIRVSALRLNNSNDTYIFAAFAENPFKISNAR